ncbi:unnamed protein product [Acanthoscelides obtectus]|uniref:Uncharacterized protein n=1 Tax=Acanthoscelides obtectus TaxID=200917 RepID=A0A9P0KEA5_ACAOB|nr:unnamed protein product [Acanthoscelides obtectus]CAK1660916.1 hypothetical protein AOBTE_LOCUS22333 [Acanthoscelides obtectus]
MRYFIFSLVMFVAVTSVTFADEKKYAPISLADPDGAAYPFCRYEDCLKFCQKHGHKNGYCYQDYCWCVL